MGGGEEGDRIGYSGGATSYLGLLKLLTASEQGATIAAI